MKNIQHSSLPNYNVYWGTYSGKNRVPKSPPPESSQKTILSNKVKSSPINNDSNFSSKTKSLASSPSTNNFVTSSSISTSYSSKVSKHETSFNSDSGEKTRSQRDLRALPLIPRMAKKWCNYPYLFPGVSRVGKTYPSSCRSLEIVRGWKENGCGVACVAMVTGRSYEECRDHAMMVGNYNPSVGIEMSGIYQTLQSLGTNAQMKHFSTWNDLPDLAIVAVWVKTGGHAVVFKRKNGKGYIFDRNATVPLSPERFKLADNQCISISKKLPDKPTPPPTPEPAPDKSCSLLEKL